MALNPDPQNAARFAVRAKKRERTKSMEPAATPVPPYFAVIFTSIRTEGDAGYSEMANRMLELAKEQPGFLGFESARADLGISVSYWTSEQAIRGWKENVLHQEAQARALEWYRYFRVRVCRVEREYGL